MENLTTNQTEEKAILIQKIEQLQNESKYTEAAQFIAKQFNLKLTSKGYEYKKHFADDKQNRYVFKMQLKRGKKSYTFKFGQSIKDEDKEPDFYSVLSCLQKYEIGTFEQFCSEFGYYQHKDGSEDYMASRKTYNAVLKEFNAMQRLFNDDELEILSYIN